MAENKSEPDEIEITPQMVEAGVQVYLDWVEGGSGRFGKFPSEAKFVETLFRVMASTQARDTLP